MNYIVKDGELYHARDHKYIEKVKTKSGKWRYIYEDIKAKVNDKTGITAYREAETAAKGRGVTKNAFNKYLDEAKKLTKQLTENGGDSSEQLRKDILEVAANLQGTMQGFELATDKNREASLKYEASPLGKIEDAKNFIKKIAHDLTVPDYTKSRRRKK